MKNNVLVLLVLLFLNSCSDGSKTDPISDDPSNLTLEATIATDDSGIVTVIANADNTAEYTFDPGVFGNVEFTNTTGIFEYTYENSGSYTIEVKAFGSSGRFIKANKSILVETNDDVPIGDGYSTPMSYPGMDLVWNDEFNGAALNTEDWDYDIGTGCPDLCGWGNNELQYYRSQNVWVSQGVVTLEARDELFQGNAYTSGKIVTRGKKIFKYGRIDIRALLPKGQGLWPALWLLGDNQDEVGWPECGEIDIMEMIGGSGRENRITGNVFWDDNGVIDQPNGYTLSSGTFDAKYHVFSIIWDETQFRWFVDDQLFHSFNITDPSKSEFQEPFYIIFNVAVGGNFPGSPDETTSFPTSMKVDYIRVFQDQ